MATFANADRSVADLHGFGNQGNHRGDDPVRNRDGLARDAYRGTSPTIGPYAKPWLDAKIAELVGDTDVQLVPLHEPHFSRSEIF
jgi:hypothetical protein